MTKLLLSCILLLGLLAPAPAAETSDRPNVVILFVDDLGSGDVSCLFRDQVKTPSIDRLAATGVTFTSGYVTHPLCGPSRAGLFTGRYPQRFGFLDNGGGIPTDLPLLPGVLRDAGYRTALIGKWHSTGPMPHERGCFDETLCSARPSPFIDFHHPKLARNGKLEECDEYSTDLFAREAEQFIGRNKDRPFALTVTFNAPHILRVVKNARLIQKDYDAAVAAGQILDVPKVPMARPGEAAKYADQFPGDTARADTVATIAALDEAVGRILDSLKTHGLDRKTVVFFLADNGGHPENRSDNLPLRDYKWSLYEGGIRVPFLAAFPGVFPAGLKFEHPVSSMDIFPTCAALAGLEIPAGLDGVNLVSHLQRKPVTAPHEELFFSHGKGGAVRQGPWKLVISPEGPAELFHLADDVAEKHNLSGSQPDLVRSLKAKWTSWHQQIPAVSAPAGENGDPKPNGKGRKRQQSHRQEDAQ